MDEITRKLVTYARELDFVDISPAAVHAAKRSMVDSIGCALGVFRAEPIAAIRRLAAESSATTPATVIGTAIESSAELAAFANSAMIRYRDFSDDYFGGRGDIGPHPSDNIGGVLAAAEATGGDGKALIGGIVVAYEAIGQILDHISLPPGKRIWDYPVLHSIATSLGAGRVLGLTDEQLANALGVAAVSNITLNQARSGQLSDWKGLAGPNGSRNGLFAALLARQGITGPTEPFDGSAGLARHLNVHFGVGQFGGGGVPFRIEGTYFKYFPVRYHCQLPVWTAFELRQKVDPGAIESITLYLAGRYVTDRGKDPDTWDPQTHGTADHSFPYLVAAALIDGELTERTLTPARYRDPQVLALAGKISLAEEPSFTEAFPKTFNACLEATLAGGEVVVAHQTNPKGHPDNPMTDGDLEAKFLTQVDGVIPETQARDVLARLWDLENAGSIKDLIGAMRV